MQKVNYSYYCHFADLEFIQLPERVKACVLMDEKMPISQNSLLLGKLLEPLTGNVVISEVHAFMYVVLSKTEKHVPF
jgi:hypothetical protein